MRNKVPVITSRIVTKTYFGVDTYELTLRAVYDHCIELKILTYHDRPGAQAILEAADQWKAELEDEYF